MPYFFTLTLFALLVWGGRQISFTSDEPAHIATGYALLARGKDAFWMLPSHGHPPLLNVLEAALLYLESPDIPLEQLDGWPSDHIRYVRAFVEYLPPPERAEVIARIPIMLCTLPLGALLFRWAKEFWGYPAGLIALFVFCFDPLVLAHGRLATTDVGTVTFGTASLYIFWHWLKSPSWKKGIVWGILLGLTMLAKGNGILWAGTVMLICLWRAIRDQKTVWLLQGAVGGLIGFFILWAGHGFTWGPVKELPIPLFAPAYWSGLIAQAQSSQERWVFALGLRKTGNWWWYFPLSFLIKNPVPLILTFAIGGFQFIRTPSLSFPVPLGFFALLYSFASWIGGMNIGYRHFLPVHPFIYLVIGGGLTSWLSIFRSTKLIAILIFGGWYALGTIRIFPYEIAYFNELIGGPQKGHLYLIDSNLDWGQGYKALRLYLSNSYEPLPKLVYQYTYIPPEYYGINADSFPAEIGVPSFITPFRPASGRYVISITTLQRGWPGNDVYYWFRQTQPTAIVGFSFFVYDVRTSPLRWIAQCAVPVAPLSESAIRQGFEEQNLRQIEFDCTSGWIYPFGGAQPGVYSIHYDLLKRAFPFPPLSSPEPRDPFVTRRLNQARLSADVNRYTPDHPAFVLYEQEEAPEIPAPCSAWALPADGALGDEGTLVSVPVALNGPLAFLGVNVFRESSEMDVETWWQVTEGPITRPLSIIGHLLRGTGEMIGQNDGLGVSPVVWLPGDLIIQRHRFPSPPKGEHLWLRTGVYWLDTMERWPLAERSDLDTILVKLPEVR